MSNEGFVLIIASLIAAHYVSMIWELRRLRDDIGNLRIQVHAAAMEAAKAALAAGHAAAVAAVAPRQVAIYGREEWLDAAKILLPHLTQAAREQMWADFRGSR